MWREIQVAKCRGVDLPRDTRSCARELFYGSRAGAQLTQTKILGLSTVTLLSYTPG